MMMMMMIILYITYVKLINFILFVLCYIDEISVELENVHDKLVELETKVKGFVGEHKNNLFYDIQGKRNELQLKLDEIDLAYQEDLKEVSRGY